MPEATHSVTILRPRHDVFAFVADHANDPRWRSGILEIRRESGDGVGERWHQAMRGPLGRSIAADIETTELEPDRRLGFHGTAGPVRPTGRYSFEDDAGGTRVTFSLSAELRGAKRLMAPMVGKTMEAEVRALDRLKHVLESQR